MQCQEWLKKKSECLSHDNQNELLKIMTLIILRSISKNLQKTGFISVMMDECADVTNIKQVHKVHM